MSAQSLPESESPRIARLKAMTKDRQPADVSTQLTKIWEAGHRPERIRFRRPYARREQPAPGPFSDRKVPPRKLRPPSTRLILPRGVAQSMYLTMMFVAQCEATPGKAPPAGRPIADPRAPEHRRPWTDLVVVPAEHRPGATSRLIEMNRVRQLETAVKKLADNDVRLVHLPFGDEARGKLKEFEILAETGYLGRASRMAYTVPKSEEQTFSVPASFFLQGWLAALTPSEVGMLFAIWAASPADTAATSPVWLEGDIRIRHYGLSPDAYGSQSLLEELGLLKVTVPPGRRPDGTFVGHKKGESPLLNSFQINEPGLTKDAVPWVMATLKNRSPRSGP